jgi:hypothetical protein
MTETGNLVTRFVRRPDSSTQLNSGRRFDCDSELGSRHRSCSHNMLRHNRIVALCSRTRYGIIPQSLVYVRSLVHMFHLI